MSWTPEQVKLREELIEEVSFVLGEAPGSKKGIEIVLKVLETLEKLGWKRVYTLEEAAQLGGIEKLTGGAIKGPIFSVADDDEEEDDE